MKTTPPAVACATSMIDALVESGVRDFVLSPGSRSAPLALVLADREVRRLVRLHVRTDERSAGFFALGIARASNSPVALVCTSGSAVANLHPAVVEADQSAVPLLLLTADRPAELRRVGASQTIRQTEIFGDSVRWFQDVVAPETGAADEIARWSSLAARAVQRARAERGPVHLNLMFRFPLVGRIPAPLPGLDLTDRTAGNTAPATQGQGSGEEESRSEDRVPLGDVGHGVLVVGDLPMPPPGSTDMSGDVLLLAEDLGWPVIAEPTANLTEHPNLLSHGPLIVGSPDFIADHRPDLVISVGRFGLSRPVTAFVATAGQHWALSVDGRGEPADPGLSADRILTALPVSSRSADADTDADADQASDPLPANHRTAPMAGSGWLADWIEADRTVGLVVRQEIWDAAASTETSGVTPDSLSGAGAALAVWDSALPDETVFLAASWPIRFIDSFAGSTNAACVLANRGTNGIDGLVSTALGAATARRDLAPSEPPDPDASSGRVVAILGDVAFLHDIGGLVGAGQSDVSAVLVVLNNDGGGIFAQLEQAAPAYERDFERVFGTPHGQDLAGIARSMGVSACDVRTLPDLQDALMRARAAGGAQVIVAHTSDRREEAALLRRIATASAVAINEIGK